MRYDIEAETRSQQRRAVYWIREWASRRGISINRLSMEARVSSPSLYDLLRLRTTPNLRTLVSLAQALEVELADLFQPVPNGVVVAGVDEVEPEGQSPTKG